MNVDWPAVTLAMSCVILITDLIWQYYWAGYIGPKTTKERVIAEFQNPITAAKVSLALGIPTKADLAKTQKMTFRRIRQIQLDVVRAGELVQDAKTAIAELAKAQGEFRIAIMAQIENVVKKAIEDNSQNLNIEIDPDKVAKEVTASIRGALAKDRQVDASEDREVLDDFQASSEYDTVVAMSYQALIDHGIPEGAARWACERGPRAIKALIREYGWIQDVMDFVQPGGEYAGVGE
jgi:hypothetical protein